MVGRKLVFPTPMPDGTSTRGLTFEEYLVAQVAMGIATVDTTVERIASLSVDLARAIVLEMDRRREWPLPGRENVPEAVDMYAACESEAL